MFLRGNKGEVNADEGEWLWDEGVSRTMRAEMEGIGTPWRRSTVGVEIDVGERDEDEDEIRKVDDEEESRKLLLIQLQAELDRVLANQITVEEGWAKSEKELTKLKKEKLEKEAISKEEKIKLEEEIKVEKMKREKVERDLIEIEGDAHEVRLHLEEEISTLKSKVGAGDRRIRRSSSRGPSRASSRMREDAEKKVLESKVALATLAGQLEIGTLITLEDAIKAERYVLKNQMESLGLIAKGILVWAQMGGLSDC